MSHPRLLGPGSLPRFGSGWMHQFGAVYCLQQELLNARAASWFRAFELWHAARDEGIALNVSHYRNMTRQCVLAQRWDAALRVVAQMRRDAIRADAAVVGSVLSCCADAAKWQEAARVLQHFSVTEKLRLDAHCYHAAALASLRGHRWQTALTLSAPLLSRQLTVGPGTTALVDASSARSAGGASSPARRDFTRKLSVRLPDSSSGPLLLEEGHADTLLEACRLGGQREFAMAVLRAAPPRLQRAVLPTPSHGGYRDDATRGTRERFTREPPAWARWLRP